MRHRIKYTAETRKRWLAEGRGQGTGANYKGWLTVHDVPATKSNKLRLPERCHRRTCHLLSGVEERAFLYYDFSPWTTAIYDQFRLDLDETVEIAKQLGIEHPRVPITGELWDMTTDLVVISNRGDTEMTLPRNCKMAKDLGVWNNIEHAEIERVYWERRVSNLKCITEEDRCIPNVVHDNLVTMETLRFLEDQKWPYEGFLDDMLQRMHHALVSQSHDCTLTEFCQSFDATNSLRGGLALQLALYFIYRHFIDADLTYGDIREQSILDIQARTLERVLPYQARQSA